MDMIDLRYVKKLIEMLDGSTVDSIEISSEKGMKLRLSKTAPQQRGAVQMAAVAPVAPAVVAQPAAAPAAPADPAVTGAGGAGAAAGDKAARTDLIEVKSPMVGTYYKAPEPGARPYVSVGDRIAQGQVLCIIEAMKIMNEIESEVAGVVVEIRAEDSHAVEYGQVLFRIDPHA